MEKLADGYQTELGQRGVNLSGGQIRVESQQGEWCRFVFTLPAELPNKRDLLKLSDQTQGSEPRGRKKARS